MHWHLLHFGDLQRKSVPEQLFAFADAYLESAGVLCERLCTEAEHSTYAHGAVIMSLTFHSQELFLKAAISLKAPDERYGHDLDQLANRYSNLYPGKKYGLDVRFRCPAPDTDGMEPSVAAELLAYDRQRRKEMPENELHRYPISKKDRPWNAALGFEPNSFYSEIQRIKSDFARIRSHLLGG